MGLEAGMLDGNDEFVDQDCMARYMEDAMPEPTTDEDTGKRGRREFLIAISTGIINYLKAHDEDSFKVSVGFQGNDYTGELKIL